MCGFKGKEPWREEDWVTVLGGFGGQKGGRGEATAALAVWLADWLVGCGLLCGKRGDWRANNWGRNRVKRGVVMLIMKEVGMVLRCSGVVLCVCVWGGKAGGGNVSVPPSQIETRNDLGLSRCLGVWSGDGEGRGGRKASAAAVPRGQKAPWPGVVCCF